MAESDSGRPNGGNVELSRDLGLFDVTMIGVGAMIGAGIFVLTGIAAGAAGPALVLSFALNGIISIFTAMVYAELGSAIPEASGGYLRGSIRADFRRGASLSSKKSRFHWAVVSESFILSRSGTCVAGHARLNS